MSPSRNPWTAGGKPKKRAPTRSRSTARSDSFAVPRAARPPVHGEPRPARPGRGGDRQAADDAEVRRVGHQVDGPAEAVPLDVQGVEPPGVAGAQVDVHGAGVVLSPLLVHRGERRGSRPRWRAAPRPRTG